MRHVRDLADLKLPATAVTIGSFDGVHLGHQSLARALASTARADGLPAVVLTFFPHPSVVLRSRRPAYYITSPDEKAALLGELGIDYVITQPFDRALAAVHAEAFLGRLRSQLGMKHLCIGEDFALGHGREGNRSFLEAAAPRFGYTLHVLPPVLAGGEAVSSTRIREALSLGDVARAAALLGRPFTVSGTVVRGAGRGRSLDIPTANLRIWEERATPTAGVYACVAEVESGRYKAVTNIGVRPTFEPGQDTPVVESHLLDFNGDLYGREMRLIFVDRLRDEKRFSGPQELVQQIHSDIDRARRILAGRPEVGDG